MLENFISRPANPETVKQIHLMFRAGNLTLKEQSIINRAVTGSVSQRWPFLEAEMLLGMMIDTGSKKLKAWAAEIEAAS